MSGYMLMFNGFCITLLGYMTEFGITTEELAKWHELDTFLIHGSACISIRRSLTPSARDPVAGAVVAAIGFVLARGAESSERRRPS